MRSGSEARAYTAPPWRCIGPVRHPAGTPRSASRAAHAHVSDENTSSSATRPRHPVKLTTR
uniref:Uncharacterized protein n=1 Tax=Arundo donax TaxID=35708 RepID=A0A0A9HK68_ARUDO